MSDGEQQAGGHFIALPELLIANLTPFALAIFTSDLNSAIKSIDSNERFSAAKYFLVCLSIELALKSSLLSKGVPKLQVERYGHDLSRVLDEFIGLFQPSFISQKDREVVAKMVKYYHRENGSKKGLVYFEANMKAQALRGYRDIPDIANLESIHDRLQRFLRQNGLFIE